MFSKEMNNTYTSKNFVKINLDWSLIQSELKSKLGSDVYESWIRKINLTEEFNNYILFLTYFAEKSRPI